MNNKIINEVFSLLKNIFFTSFFTFLIFKLIETTRPGYISNYFNYNIFLYIFIVVTILIGVIPHKYIKNKNIIEKRYYNKFIIISFFIIILIIFLQTKELGFISYLISLLVILILIGSYIIFFRNNTD